MVSCAHLSVALRVALGASTWPGKRGFTIRRSSPTQRRNGRAFASLTARGGGLPIGVTYFQVLYWHSPILQSLYYNLRIHEKCVGLLANHHKYICRWIW